MERYDLVRQSFMRLPIATVKRLAKDQEIHRDVSWRDEQHAKSEVWDLVFNPLWKNGEDEEFFSLARFMGIKESVVRKVHKSTFHNLVTESAGRLLEDWMSDLQAHQNRAVDNDDVMIGLASDIAAKLADRVPGKLWMSRSTLGGGTTLFIHWASVPPGTTGLAVDNAQIFLLLSIAADKDGKVSINIVRNYGLRGTPGLVGRKGIPAERVVDYAAKMVMKAASVAKERGILEAFGSAIYEQEDDPRPGQVVAGGARIARVLRDLGGGKWRVLGATGDEYIVRAGEWRGVPIWEIAVYEPRSGEIIAVRGGIEVKRAISQVTAPKGDALSGVWRVLGRDRKEYTVSMEEQKGVLVWVPIE